MIWLEISSINLDLKYLVIYFENRYISIDIKVIDMIWLDNMNGFKLFTYILISVGLPSR